jgi:hypothetical protein
LITWSEEKIKCVEGTYDLERKKYFKLLFDYKTNMDVLRFYSGSKDKNAGHGTGENVSDDQLYEELNKIRNWMQVLSNFHIFPFTHDDPKGCHLLELGLHIACEGGHTELAQLMIQKGATGWDEGISVAIDNNQIHTVEYLLL